MLTAPLLAPLYRSCPPVAQLGRFELLGRLALGGMSEIFLGRDPSAQPQGREIVIKRILPHVASDPQVRAMFMQEAKLSLLLHHPNVCSVYEFGEVDGALYLAMEWAHGVSLRTLAARARAWGGLPPSLGARILADVASALHYVHTAADEQGRALGIIHRDVTPDNIVICFDGQVKLLDFGIAKPTQAQLQHTQEGVLKGKLGYISPEQFRGDPIDARSDIFALGICMYESLTGQPLYRRNSHYETVAAIVLDPRVPSLRRARPELPPALDEILKRALAKDRDERYENAGLMAEELKAFASIEKRSVRSKDLARLLRQLFPQELARGPRLDRSPAAMNSGQSWSVPTKSYIKRKDGSERILDVSLQVKLQRRLQQRQRIGHILGSLLFFASLTLALAAWMLRF